MVKKENMKEYLDSTKKVMREFYFNQKKLVEGVNKGFSNQGILEENQIKLQKTVLMLILVNIVLAVIFLFVR